MVIKDNLDYGGLVTTAGFSGFSRITGGIDMIPQNDATVVAQLRDAGAIVLGKTNLPDFAADGTRTRSSVAGVTLNPYNTDKAPGGSSGGTATAVNANFAVLGLGTETGGGVRRTPQRIRPRGQTLRSGRRGLAGRLASTGSGNGGPLSTSDLHADRPGCRGR